MTRVFSFQYVAFVNTNLPEDKRSAGGTVWTATSPFSSKDFSTAPAGRRRPRRCTRAFALAATAGRAAGRLICFGGIHSAPPLAPLLLPGPLTLLLLDALVFLFLLGFDLWGQARRLLRRGRRPPRSTRWNRPLPTRPGVLFLPDVTGEGRRTRGRNRPLCSSRSSADRGLAPTQGPRDRTLRLVGLLLPGLLLQFHKTVSGPLFLHRLSFDV